MRQVFLTQGTDNKCYITFGIVYWVIMQESGIAQFVTQNNRHFVILSTNHQNGLYVTENMELFEEVLKTASATFHEFVSRYIQNHYPTCDDKIARIEGSYAVVENHGITALVPVNPETGKSIGKPCATIKALFNHIISQTTIESIVDLLIDQKQKITKKATDQKVDEQMFTAVQYLAYMLKIALDLGIPLDYRDAVSDYSQKIKTPQTCHHRQDPSTKINCSCYANYNTIIAKTGFKIR